MAYQFKPVLVCSACWTMHAVWETRRANGRANSRELFAGWWFGESYGILDPSGTTVNLDTARQRRPLLSRMWRRAGRAPASTGSVHGALDLEPVASVRHRHPGGGRRGESRRRERGSREPGRTQ